MNKDNVTIASVYYRPLSFTMALRDPSSASGGFHREYTVQASSDRQPRLLTVKTMLERRGEVDGYPVTAPVTADEIARALVQMWGDGGELNAYGGPGVMIIEGHNPTQDELNRMLRRQTTMCSAGVNIAQNFWLSGQRERVMGNYEYFRDMALWLGKTDYEWVKPPQTVSTVSCPHCGGEIPDNVGICRHCGNIANATIYMRTKREQEAVMREMESLQEEVLKENPEADFALPPEVAALEPIAEVAARK